MKDPRRNEEGYLDLTAYEAMKNLEKDRRDEARFKKLLKTIFSICELAGFTVEGRISLYDRHTGKTWR